MQTANLPSHNLLLWLVTHSFKIQTAKLARYITDENNVHFKEFSVQLAKKKNPILTIVMQHTHIQDALNYRKELFNQV